MQKSKASMPTIGLRAYQLWDAADRPEGQADKFWFQAEEELRKLLEREINKDDDLNRTTPAARD